MPAPRPVTYTPAPARPRPAPPRAAMRPPVCGVDCHRTDKQQARTALGATGLAIIALTVIACLWHHQPATQAPAWDGNGGPARFYPHSPKIGAAVIGAEARGVGHAARFAGRMAFRGGVLRGLGGGGFRGYGLGGFSVGSDTPGGTGFGGFSFGGF